MSEQWVVLITASIPPLWPIIRAIGERAAAISQLSSVHSLSSMFRASGRGSANSRSNRSNPELADELCLVEQGDDKPESRGVATEQDHGHIEGEHWKAIKVQKAITRHCEVGQGSSVTASAERAS